MGISHVNTMVNMGPPGHALVLFAVNINCRTCGLAAFFRSRFYMPQSAKLSPGAAGVQQANLLLLVPLRCLDLLWLLPLEWRLLLVLLLLLLVLTIIGLLTGGGI